MELELSNLGSRTHVWFPLPQRIDSPTSYFSNETPRIKRDEKYGNLCAYFCFAGYTRTITAEFPVSDLVPDAQKPRGSEFLLPNRFVESNESQIRTIAQALTHQEETDEEKARRCFDWVIGYLSYGNPIRGLYSSLQALTDRTVDCGGFSTLEVSLLRSIGIPARCVLGWAIQSKFGYHAWVEHYDRQQQTWIPSDPSVAQLGKKTKLDAGFGFIHDKRVIFSVGEDLLLEGNGITWPTPLLQSPVVVSLDKNGIPIAISETLKWRSR